MDYLLHYYYLIPSVCAIFSMVAGIRFYSYIPYSLRLLILNCLASFVTDFVCRQFQDLNFAITNFYLVADFFLLLFATYSCLQMKNKNLFYAVSSVVFISVWSYSVYEYGINYLANLAIVTMALLITLNYLLLLLFNVTNPDPTSKVPIRILCFGIIIYYCGTFPLFMVIQFLMKIKMPVVVMDINTVLDFTKFFLIGLSFYKFKQYSDTLKAVPNE